MPKIYLIDVTNRDGVQTAKLGLSKLEKTMINLYLNEMGVFQSEFGFPTTRHETNYLLANLEMAETGAFNYSFSNPDTRVPNPIRLSGWIRAITEDVETTYRYVPSIKHLALSISTSDQMITGKFQGRKKRHDIIKEMTEAVDAALACGAESVAANAEDASRTDINYLIEFGLAAKEHGAVRVRYCDTLGYDNPFTIYDNTRKLAEAVCLPIELHCHNDLGMAVANSIAGAMGVIDGGQDAYINTTINGIGERAGNADLIAVVLSVCKSKGFNEKYKFANEIKLKHASKIAKFASYAFGVPIPINQPGVGANAFAHASGIHADGVLKDPYNYELYGYEELGRGDPEFVETGRQIITGEYSGISGFSHVMSKLKVPIEFPNREKADEILELARYANVESQRPLVEDQLIFIARYPEIARKLLTLTPLV